MKPWVYSFSESGKIIKELPAPYWLESKQVEMPRCRYCGSNMAHQKIEDLWPMKFEEYDRAHRSGMNIKRFSRETGVPIDNIELEKIDTEALHPSSYECYSLVCRVCGWWILGKRVYLSAKVWQIWELYFAAVGSLKNLDLTNVKVPIDEVRRFLAAKYESRFLINPRKFEETVESVFRDVGYRSQLTNYRNDGGIDIFLSDSENKQIGVQVKRHREKIKVEQIRTLLGAAIINDCIKGILVTTSDFQKGAYKLSERCNEEFVPIELVNGEKFLEILKIAQINSFEEFKDYPFKNLKRIPKLKIHYSSHLNSL
ncbi:restriction endonuclease [Leptospira yasudae]|uniref:restriction endonuclease n=1 Tax=Leptospira yasudae TaxID=2202201 RepID=UPI001C5020CE|nr:restriction endonuclease [Leptospira yasudae]MBW0434988.1 restriction endonuclease [Leptospira yasudae]